MAAIRDSYGDVFFAVHSEDSTHVAVSVHRGVRAAVQHPGARSLLLDHRAVRSAVVPGDVFFIPKLRLVGESNCFLRSAARIVNFIVVCIQVV